MIHGWVIFSYEPSPILRVVKLGCGAYLGASKSRLGLGLVGRIMDWQMGLHMGMTLLKWLLSSDHTHLVLMC